MQWCLSHTFNGLLITLVSMATHVVSLWETSSPGTIGSQRSCDEIRTEITRGFLNNFKQGVPQAFIDQFVPLWVELALPKECRGMGKQAFIAFNPSSTQDNGGPLGTLGNSGTIYTKSMKLRKRREATSDVTNEVSSDQALNREKRFLHGMTLGGPPHGAGGPKKEVSESAQMMNMFLMLSKLQKRRLKADYGRMQPNRNDFYGEAPNFGGLYGSQYMGRKKREATSPAMETSADGAPVSNTAEESIVRKKRFLLTEPGDVPAGGVNPMSQMMGILMGTARDPNTGKKLKFGGDAMKNMMRTSFMNTLPESARPPAGKEPGDFVKNMAPFWYFSRFQRSMSPPAYVLKDPGDFPMRTSGYVQKRNRDGTFGDAYPRGRKKRSAEEDSDSSSSNSDVITFGDMTIPMDFFRPAERSESPPAITQRPMYYPMYPPAQRMTRHMRYRYRAPMNRIMNGFASPVRGYKPMLANRFPTRPVAPLAHRRFAPLMQHHHMRHGRKKRASDNSENSNNDVLTVGDVSIPMDFFKPSDDSPQAQTPAPRYVPVYRPVVYRQPVYVNRYIPYHQRQPTTYPIQYYRQYARAIQNWQRTNQIYNRQARHWNAQPRNQWVPPVNRWAPPPTPANRPAPPLTPITHWGPPAPQTPALRAPPSPTASHVPPPQPQSPFLPPVPPTPPHQLPPPSHRRVKRSDNKDKTDSSSSGRESTFFPMFMPPSPLFPMWSSPRFSGPNKMMVSNTPTGGAIFGDTIPWARQGRGSPMSPFFGQQPRTSALRSPSAFAPRSPAPPMSPLEMFYRLVQRNQAPVRSPLMPRAPFRAAQGANPYSFGAMSPAWPMSPPVVSSQSNMMRPFVPPRSPQPQLEVFPAMGQGQPLAPQPNPSPNVFPPQNPALAPAPPSAVQPPLQPLAPAPSNGVPPQSPAAAPLSLPAGQPPVPAAPPGAVPPPPLSAAAPSPFLPIGG